VNPVGNLKWEKTLRGGHKDLQKCAGYGWVARHPRKGNWEPPGENILNGERERSKPLGRQLQKTHHEKRERDEYQLHNTHDRRQRENFRVVRETLRLAGELP